MHFKSNTQFVLLFSVLLGSKEYRSKGNKIKI